MVTCRGRVLTEDDFAFLAESRAKMLWSVPAGISLQEVEKYLIAATLQQTGGNIKEPAQILGIDRSTLYEKLKKYGIPDVGRGLFIHTKTQTRRRQRLAGCTFWTGGASVG